MLCSRFCSSPAEVVKVGSLQPLHRAVYAAPVGGTDHEVTIKLVHHLMDCLTEQVRDGQNSNLNSDP